jgi:hypothetical protein
MKARKIIPGLFFSSSALAEPVFQSVLRLQSRLVRSNNRAFVLSNSFSHCSLYCVTGKRPITVDRDGPLFAYLHGDSGRSSLFESRVFIAESLEFSLQLRRTPWAVAISLKNLKRFCNFVSSARRVRSRFSAALRALISRAWPARPRVSGSSRYWLGRRF